MLDPTTQSLVDSLRKLGLRGAPCDESTVTDLQRQFAVEWPAAYKAFLLIAGNGCEALEGSAYAIEDDLGALQQAGLRIASHAKIKLPKDAFVFRVHQGFVYTFFLLRDGDDPPVYECVEGLGASKLVAARFTDWVAAVIGGAK